MRKGMQFIMTNTGWRCCEQWRPWGRTGRLYLLIKSVRVCPASKRSPHETAITHTQQHQTISWQHEAPLLLNNQTRTGIEQPPNATTCTAARSSSQQRGKARQANTHTNSRSGKSAGASSIQAYTPAVAHCVTSLTQTEPQPTSTKSRSSAPVPQPARRAAGRQPKAPRRRRAPCLARSPAETRWRPALESGPTSARIQTRVTLHQDGTPLGSTRHDRRTRAPAPVP